MVNKTKNTWRTTKRPILALAPMAGYTDPAFRVMCLKHGADIVYTEMVSVEAIWRKNKKTLEMLKTLPGEKNVILQLFGSKPESFAKALRAIHCHPELVSGSRPTSMGSRNKFGMTKLSGIDVNFGCPARKVYSTGAGAALMNNKKRAKKIIQTVLDNTNLPVSIKIRSQVKNVSAIEFVEFIKDLPISGLMIHGRTLKQGFSGKIDYEMIKQVKKLLPNIPVLANGGINTPEDAKIMLEKTGADGLGIARGSWGKPYIFNQIKSVYLNGHLNGHKINWLQIKKYILEHAKLFLKYSDNLIPLRKHLVHYTRGQKNASKLRQKIIKVETLEDLKKI